jgi:hypothetical protein
MVWARDGLETETSRDASMVSSRFRALRSRAHILLSTLRLGSESGTRVPVDLWALHLQC